MGKRGTHDWSKERLPVGTVRIRTRRRGRNVLRVRMIKVRGDGPKGRRWVNYARWWWEQHRGPVPEGCRVVHLDGDPMNDDPENLALLTPGDVAFLCHDRDPDMSKRNYRKLREATRQHNRDRGRVNRALNWLPTYWYPVDAARQLIVNAPRRKRWEVYAEFGIPNPRTCQPAKLAAAALGWPDRRGMEAFILAVLVEANGSLRIGDVRLRVAALRSWHDVRPHAPRAHSYFQYFRPLVDHGLIGRTRQTAWITDRALDARGPHSPVVARRGRDVAELEQYRKVDREQWDQAGD